MKKVVFLLVLLASLISCSINDDNNRTFEYEILPIESVDMPNEFVLGEVYTIYVTYNKPSGCHVFSDFYYVSELNQRTIAVISTIYTNQDCAQTSISEEVSFDFIVNNNGTYVFRFWQGEDENGNDLYYIVEVPVVE
ncbi:hypothetical protein A9Q87_03860 [Flavobacteriales bacterium 34_180_T64]|nr:hypothetical protein A9Q87_03860 [Flavobacteriales bacterium 34_180_T64]